MSFVMIASGSAGGSGLRTVSMRCVIGVAAAVAGLLLATGAGLGYWVFAPAQPAATTVFSESHGDAAAKFQRGAEPPLRRMRGSRWNRRPGESTNARTEWRFTSAE